MVTKRQMAILESSKKVFKKLVLEAQRLKSTPAKYLAFMDAYDRIVKEIDEETPDVHSPAI